MSSIAATVRSGYQIKGMTGPNAGDFKVTIRDIRMRSRKGVEGKVR